MVRRTLVVLVALAPAGSLLFTAGAAAAETCASEGATYANQALREEQHAAFLPDCRAYELVSPPQKNGGEVVVDASRTRVSSAGDAVSFASLAGFGDARGTGIATEYMSLRDGAAGTTGWSTHGITPPQEPFTLTAAFNALEPLYFGDFSADLSRGVFQAWSEIPSTPFAPNVARVENLYARDDLRDPGAGSYRLLTEAFAPVGWPNNPLGNLSKPFFDAASADFSHIVFESAYPLTADSTASTGPLGNFGPGFVTYNVFDASGGQVHLVGLIPPPGETTCGQGGPACVAAASSVAGQGEAIGLYTERTVSADGSRIFFTDDPQTGALFMRVDDARTVQINASERTDCAGDPTCGGNGVPDPAPDTPQPASFGTASLDGSRVFFISSEALTDDASGGAHQLYMYDASKPASDPHNLTLIANRGAQGVLGASDDGRYVYFVARTQLVAGQPDIQGNDAVYAWHDDGTPSGTLRYVGELTDDNDVAKDVPSGWTGGPVQSRVSPDGRYLVFSSHSGVGLLSAHGGVDYDQGTACGREGCEEELYVYEADTQALRCVSCNPSGAAATANAFLTVTGVSEGGAEVTSHFEHALSDDGRFVFFTSGEALVPRDTNGRNDVYEFDTRDGSVHLLSSGTDSSDSYLLGSSANGDDAFIGTQSRLVGWDTDAGYDVYDVRVGGGVPEPPVAPPGCAGEECHGSSNPAPAFGGLSSLGFTGAGNATRSSVHRPLTRAQRFRRALASCRHRPRRTRHRCEVAARRRFGKASRVGRGK